MTTPEETLFSLNTYLLTHAFTPNTSVFTPLTSVWSNEKPPLNLTIISYHLVKGLRYVRLNDMTSV